MRRAVASAVAASSVTFQRPVNAKRLRLSGRAGAGVVVQAVRGCVGTQPWARAEPR